ncbi:MAG: hypothetical protein VKJ04_03175 [Vampirovibrionales bacterium]|nr:hypothetical protein [Vampirovibrionales bacterium]
MNIPSTNMPSTNIQGQVFTSPLQRVQAQQAFQTKKAKPSEQEAPVQASPIEVSKQPSNLSLPAHIFNARRLGEIKQIALQAGYVGLDDNDIARAYATGESLLTDYRA